MTIIAQLIGMGMFTILATPHTCPILETTEIGLYQRLDECTIDAIQYSKKFPAYTFTCVPEDKDS